MGKIAFLFAGQGAQYSGMGKDLYENIDEVKALYDELEAMRPGTMKQCFDSDEETLKKTENTQPCLFATDYACAMALESRGIHADETAGFSLGEVVANAYAETKGTNILNMETMPTINRIGMSWTELNIFSSKVNKISVNSKLFSKVATRGHLRTASSHFYCTLEK